MTEKQNHYMIGYCFNQNFVKNLYFIKKKILKKYSHIHKESVYEIPFFTLPFIYLGYLDFKHIQIYMDRVFTPLLDELSKKVHSFPCILDNIEVVHNGSYEKVYINIKDPNHIIDSLIVPYLKECGIHAVYKQQRMIKPRIELLSIETDTPIYTSKFDYVFREPRFMVSYLTLIQQTPIHVRSGAPSFLNHSYIHNLSNYRFPLLSPQKTENVNTPNNKVPNNTGSMITQNNSNRNYNQ